MTETLTAVTNAALAKTTITLTWTPGVGTATIVRVSTATGTVLPVRNAEPATLTAGVWIGDDFEAPLAENFYYQATSVDSASIITSATYFIDAAGETMLKHPGRPALNSWVHLEAGPDLERPIMQGVHDVLGRRMPIAVSMRRSSERGTLQLITFTDAERAALLLLTDDGTPLLFSTSLVYGFSNVYVAVGDLTEKRASSSAVEQTRRWDLPFVVVDRPAGAALAVGNTWSDALTAYTSWQTLLAGEGTWAGLLEGLGS